MILISDALNAGNPAIHQILLARDAERLQQRALREMSLGSHFLDLCPGPLGEQEPSLLSWMVQTVQEKVPLPVSLDSRNHASLSAALQVHQGKSLMNSSTCDKEVLERFLLLARETRSYLVVMATEAGKSYGHELEGIGHWTGGTPPQGVERRLLLFKRGVEVASRLRFPVEDLFLDPCLLPQKYSPQDPPSVLRVIRRAKEEFPCKTILGLRNIAYGVSPSHAWASWGTEGSFLLLAREAGLDAVILNLHNEVIRQIVQDSLRLE